jgi:hypothetical protein
MKIHGQLLLAATSLTLLGLSCSHAPVGQSSQDSVVVGRSNPDQTVVQLKGNWVCGSSVSAKDDVKTCTENTTEARKPGSVSQQKDDGTVSDRYFQAHAINARY